MSLAATIDAIYLKKEPINYDAVVYGNSSGRRTALIGATHSHVTVAYVSKGVPQEVFSEQ